MPLIPLSTGDTFISENIGPGPNSIAVIRIHGGSLSEREEHALRDCLLMEDGAQIAAVNAWLGQTRDITLTLGGAHHEMQTEREEDIEWEYCVFCGGSYRWTVRCPANRDGAV